MSQYGPGGGGGYGPPGGGGYGPPPGGGGYGPPGGGYGPPPGGPGGPGGVYSPPGADFGPPMGGGDPNAAARASTPAIILMILVGLETALALVMMVFALMGNAQSMDQMPAEYRQYQTGPAGTIVFYALVLAVNGFIIFGLNKMRQAQSWTISLVCVILAMIPLRSCMCCCLPGLPSLGIGIWALVVLMNDQVKAAFNNS